MDHKKFGKIFLFFVIFSIIIFLIYIKFFKNNKLEEIQNQNRETTYNSNIIKDVEYSTKDKDGNEYLIKAKEGEIDFSNTNVIFLKK